ncbi:MAG: hypothetical protein ACLR6J_04205 [Parabacteroides merdae]
MSQPTNAQRLTTFLKYSEGTSASRQNGSRVKNIKAARDTEHGLEINN